MKAPKYRIVLVVQELGTDAYQDIQASESIIEGDYKAEIERAFWVLTVRNGVA